MTNTAYKLDDAVIDEAKPCCAKSATEGHGRAYPMEGDCKELLEMANKVIDGMYHNAWIELSKV